MAEIVFRYIRQDDGWVTAEAFDEGGRRLEYANGTNEEEARAKLLELLDQLGYKT